MDEWRISWQSWRCGMNRWLGEDLRSGEIAGSRRHNFQGFGSCLLVKALGRKRRASFNRSLILLTWFIHGATCDITTLINHTVRHAGCPLARAGLTNLNTIFHLNNLALLQGRPTPDTACWQSARLVLFVFLHWVVVCLSAQTNTPGQEPSLSLSTTGNNEKLSAVGHQRT